MQKTKHSLFLLMIKIFNNKIQKLKTHRFSKRRIHLVKSIFKF